MIVDEIIRLIVFLTSSFEIFTGTCILVGITGHALYKIFLGLRGTPEPESKPWGKWEEY